MYWSTYTKTLGLLTTLSNYRDWGLPLLTLNRVSPYHYFKGTPMQFTATVTIEKDGRRTPFTISFTAKDRDEAETDLYALLDLGGKYDAEIESISVVPEERNYFL